MSNYDDFKAGKIYNPDDPQIHAEKAQNQLLNYEYNQTRPDEEEKRQELLRKMLPEIGQGTKIHAPFNSNWGGMHLHLGDNVYINFGLSMVDDADIYIGSFTMLGPNVSLITTNHLIAPELRKEKRYQYILPIHIKENCWLGANVTVLPGVTIGENSVIGAGSVVTHDIPANVVAVGVPCKVLREINEDDRKYYHKGMSFNPEDLH